jgi:hypothetical protein
LVVKLEGKRLLRKSRCRWEDISEIGWKGVNWIHLAQGRDKLRAVVNTVINLRVKKSGIFS